MRRLTGITLDNLDDLGWRCRSCAFWESTPAAAVPADEARAVKESWVSETLLGWGSCGQILYLDGVPVGHVLYAPPAYVPRATAFPTAPISPDAVLLMTAHLSPEHTGVGLGRVLLQGAARDLTGRGVRAVEAFGRTMPWGLGAATGCLLPVDFLRSVGFKTVRAHPVTPRLRLDMRSLLTWREDVESALERLVEWRLRWPSGATVLATERRESPVNRVGRAAVGRGAAAGQAVAGMRMTPVGGSSTAGR